MFITVLWQPEDAVHDDFVEWFRTDFAPGMLESPELLRTRIFKLQRASLQVGGQLEEKSISEMYQYMTIWEFDCDELPWEILVYLGSSERWRYYVEGGHLVSGGCRRDFVRRGMMLTKSSNGKSVNFW